MKYKQYEGFHYRIYYEFPVRTNYIKFQEETILVFHMRYSKDVLKRIIYHLNKNDHLIQYVKSCHRIILTIKNERKISLYLDNRYKIPEQFIKYFKVIE